MGSDALRSKEYCALKDLEFNFNEYDGTFSACFWIYLMNSTTFPAIILHQVYFSHFLLRFFAF
jgi:hypothetical protein